jgi:hypothetical protein
VREHAHVVRARAQHRGHVQPETRSLASELRHDVGTIAPDRRSAEEHRISTDPGKRPYMNGIDAGSRRGGGVEGPPCDQKCR